MKIEKFILEIVVDDGVNSQDLLEALNTWISGMGGVKCCDLAAVDDGWNTVSRTDGPAKPAKPKRHYNRRRKATGETAETNGPTSYINSDGDHVEVRK